VLLKNMLPYKHYAAPEIEDTLRGACGELWSGFVPETHAEESTIYR
jgi:hypothetical protein